MAGGGTGRPALSAPSDGRLNYDAFAAWKSIMPFLAPKLQWTEASDYPEESFWAWDNGFEVHVDRYPRPEAPVKLLLLHGVGTNGRLMSMLAGRSLAQRGIETIALDCPGYGVTKLKQGYTHTYGDWVVRRQSPSIHPTP